MPSNPQPPLPAPAYEQIINLYQQLGQHIITSMQRLSELHLQLGRDLLAELGDSHGRWLAGKQAGDWSSVLLPPLQPWQHYQQQLVDILSMTHSGMLQTAHEHLTAMERKLEQASKRASNAAPRASVQSTVAASRTHH
ncbi:hypothetical protein [Duganella qianjiadongensis]|uniref:Phasin domain-containing protein n=1 Tax=Duganella qianjiadongensis TaxID=2692176 RepID=A0ABW9VHP9_9BURK|nr:hypothetical protein [Duganella qianjiadongensis]MYM38170.1 hypothetical protein [Duganella qianjiadongensis]